MSSAVLPALEAVRYETLPFASAQQEAASAPHPLTLTVTCSPKHGNDHTVEFAAALRALGHTVVVHLAARMVRSHAHLDALLDQMRAADLHDVFLVGGDQPDPMGPYTRGLDLLRVLRVHPATPRSIGVPAYPEGHSQIPAAVLLDDLRDKADLADYATTQLCFHPPAISRWLDGIRSAGLTIPVQIGLPGVVDRRKLLEISMRVGVGASISFLRKQRGIGQLAGRGQGTAEHLYAEVAPLRESDLGISGFHLFTFNRLIDTVRFIEGRPLPEMQATSTSSTDRRPPEEQIHR